MIVNFIFFKMLMLTREECLLFDYEKEITLTYCIMWWI